MPKTSPDLSPALTLIRHVAEHEGHGRGRSNIGRDQAIHAAIVLAIRSGLRFDLGDFKALAAPANESYHNTSLIRFGDEVTEGYYSIACGAERGHENRSAALSYEAWCARQPFLVRLKPNDQTPARLYVGLEFDWYGARVKCTSINDRKKTALACRYAPPVAAEVCKECHREKHAYDRPKIEKRYTLSHDAIRDYHAEIKRYDALMAALATQGKAVREAIVAWAESRFVPMRKPYAFTLKELDEIDARLRAMSKDRAIVSE